MGMGGAPSANVASTDALITALNARIGEVQANPTKNTMLERLNVNEITLLNVLTLLDEVRTSLASNISTGEQR